jgi:hypothetical protein
MTTMRYLPAPLLAAAMLACAAPQQLPADAKTFRERIHAEIGDASCSSHAQCRTLPLGHKACGGPEAYAAWSSARSDNARLTQLGEAYAAARRADAERSGLVSNCMVTPDPGAQCVANRCVLRERAGPPAVQVR